MEVHTCGRCWCEVYKAWFIPVGVGLSRSI